MTLSPKRPRAGTIVDYRINVPRSWRVHKETDAHGFFVVEPAHGEGRMILATVLPLRDEPLTEESALDHARRGIASSGLPDTDLQLLHLGPRHFAAVMEGEARGEHVLAAVHVFPGRIIVGYFHSRDVDNPNNLPASRILSSIAPI
jgi:hypothetical protein